MYIDTYINSTSIFFHFFFEFYCNWIKGTIVTTKILNKYSRCFIKTEQKNSRLIKYNQQQTNYLTFKIIKYDLWTRMYLNFYEKYSISAFAIWSQIYQQLNLFNQPIQGNNNRTEKNGRTSSCEAGSDF